MFFGISFMSAVFSFVVDELERISNTFISFKVSRFESQSDSQLVIFQKDAYTKEEERFGGIDYDAPTEDDMKNILGKN